MTELEILNLVHQTFHGEAWLNYAMKYFSALAAGGTISIVLCVVLLIFKKTRRCGVALAFAPIVDVVVVNLILKNAVGRERPWTHEELSWAEDFYKQYGIDVSLDYCFPSGHTAVTFCAAAVLVIFYRAKAIPAVILAFIIGLSRIYLCEHYPTDVAAGLVIGTLCGIAGYYIYKCTAVYDRVAGWLTSKRYVAEARLFRLRRPNKRTQKFLELFI